MTYNICVYMLDGERPCSSSESPQIFGRAYAPAERPRVWRGCRASVRYRAASKSI